ncbi:MAG: 2OG-Fe(II) oxygenase [Elusimicrobia bacterium]|nr:2OG-Fe(II) oxygenase [Elusimicrobiota bacterium]
MRVIDMASLRSRASSIKEEFGRLRPFRFAVIEDFLHLAEAKRVLAEYPAIGKDWVDARGLHARGKWTQPCVAGSCAAEFYNEINSPEFRGFLSDVTGIPALLSDPDLSGAGYHQVVDGGYLDVHVDFNRHKGLDRRLNAIVYLNPDWREEYGGYLELWDMDRRERVGNVAPAFNRCVVFETNEISFHGHPVALRTGGRTRRSLSVYYYTQGRDDIPEQDDHSTLYVHTGGVRQRLRTFFNGFAHAGRKAATVQKP